MFSSLIVCVCVFSDMTNAATFRDLGKPVGALNKERLDRLLVRLCCNTVRLKYRRNSYALSFLFFKFHLVYEFKMYMAVD